MADNIVRLDLPSYTHPDTIKGDTPGAEIARQALGELYSVAGEINDTAASVKEKRRLCETARRVSERAIGKLDGAAEKIDFHVETFAKQIDAAVQPRISDTLAAELRAYFAKQDKPALAVLGAIATGDARIASAILSAPALLSGLTDEEQSLARERAASKLAPEAVRAHTEAIKAAAQVRKAREGFTETMVGRIRSWADDDAKAIAKLGRRA